MMKRHTKTIFQAAGVARRCCGMLASPAVAQRDPAYQAARSSGQVGEKMDGYLGIVGAATPALDALVKDLNIKRKAVYTQGASGAGVSVEEFAFGAGCKNIGHRRGREIPGPRRRLADPHRRCPAARRPLPVRARKGRDRPNSGPLRAGRSGRPFVSAPRLTRRHPRLRRRLAWLPLSVAVFPKFCG